MFVLIHVHCLENKHKGQEKRNTRVIIQKQNLKPGPSIAIDTQLRFTFILSDNFEF